MGNTTNIEDRRIYVVLNPVAGDGKGADVEEQLPEYWQALNYTVYETSEDDDLAQVVNEALQDGYDAVAAVGGDGTVSQVANGLVETGAPLIVIPAGTGNALAKELKIPQKLEEACRLVTEAIEIRQLDAICTEDNCFFWQIGIGLESLVMKETSEAAKESIGVAAYAWTGIREAFGWQPHHFTIEIDGETHKLRAAELVAANSATMGMLEMDWGDQVSPDDGVIHLGAVKADSALDYLRSVIAMILDQTRRHALIQYFPVRESFKIEAERPLPVQGDGESVGKTPISAKVIPGALHVIVPAGEEPE